MTSPLLDNYFATLMAAAGAREVVLLNDHALPLNDENNPLRRRRQSGRKSQRRNSPSCSFGPPSCPLRKASTDNLGALKRTVRQQQDVMSSRTTTKNKKNKKTTGGNDLDRMLLQRGSNNNNNNNTNMNKKANNVTPSGFSPSFVQKTGNQSWKEDKLLSSPSSSSRRGALFRGMVAEVLETSSRFGANNNINHRGSSPTLARTTVVDYIDEVEKVVNIAAATSAAVNSSNKRKDTRWMARPEVAGLMMMEQQQ
eukprot:CAMPEP_0117055236 /NCGR_PEP_ID=MMETSP0472-20121206/38285_1 /TAXON_ID=693140 ORGANISM="Tiarina fusus, Strain LIS" /NCGR_SAMPLE_ID=MMETSP0472 /ASSEMBLY_ACC=CAM_ASM_000603 /LENGTH=253 /DNA_ID=CAMNT_0004771141 /DNA_START=36 /DNA_END=797 /DNA_ORIENTATION=+